MKYYLRLTRGQVQNSQGLELLRLALWKQDAGKPDVEVDHVTAVSGQPGRQNFLKAKDRWPGSMQPLGEAVYRLGDHDSQRGVNWASGVVGSYSGSFGPGLGPVWVAILPKAPDKFGIRSFDFGIHQDDNEDYSPGTSGCCGIQGETGPRDYGRLRRVVGWFLSFTVEELVVDWGLGTVPRPEGH